ncbi:MAG: hypothetical protein IJN54_06885 [Lachnospiraceae bacterium]|nr:hypothetical protein [Lachnospiraceae bacterium]
MSKIEMIAKLQRKDLQGVGVKALYSDGCEIFYFYEDFENDKGIDRASKHFENLINKGKVRKAEYFYKDDCLKTIPCCGCSKMDSCTMRKVI